MQAIAGALEGLPRAEAARLAGMERQALRDAVVRYNAEGLAGLYSRRSPGPRSRLDEEQRGALRQVVLDGPDVEATGLSAWTLPELCREVERRWQERWAREGTFHAPNPGEPGSERPKVYLLDMFPYPSGSGLHVGHPLGFCPGSTT